MNYLVVGLVFILVIILYYAYYYLTNNTLTSGLLELNKPTTKQYQDLKNPTAITYSYQCWLYFTAPGPANTPVFSRGLGGTGNQNEFEVVLNGQELILKGGKGVNAPTTIMSITKHFPMQKWTYLVINVSNLQTYEAYINGKLVKTVTVSTSTDFKPNSSMSSLVVGNTALSGYVTKFIRDTTVMDAKTVWTTYLSGNGLSNYFSALMPYGLTMSIANGEDVQRIFKFF
jgi:hypothetical protein